MRRHGQGIQRGDSPWPNQYPWRGAPQQSPFPFLDWQNEIKHKFVYLNPVLKMGWLHFDDFEKLPTLYDAYFLKIIL